LTGSPNKQYSYSQLVGVDFLLDSAPQDVGRIYSISSRERLLRGILTTTQLRELISSNPNWRIRPAPAHFGYQGSGEGEYEFINQEIMFITSYEIAYYTVVWPEGGRYVPDDFEMVDQDPNWNKVYQTEDFIILQWRRVNEE
jgi:hypothetical protein